ncbi:tetratricopeptide repeat protein [Nanoarchaeota archaeon]
MSIHYIVFGVFRARYWNIKMLSTIRDLYKNWKIARVLGASAMSAATVVAPVLDAIVAPVELHAAESDQRKFDLKFKYDLNGEASDHLLFDEDVSTSDDAYTRKFNTIANEFLDIESVLGVSPNSYKISDSILDESQKRISWIKQKNRNRPFSSYDREEAKQVLGDIDRVFEDKGIEYEKNALLSVGLDKLRIDCDNYSVMYLAVAELVGLPLKMVFSPGHAFIRWHFENGTYMNWETTSGINPFDDLCKDNPNFSAFYKASSPLLKAVGIDNVSPEDYCMIYKSNMPVVVTNEGDSFVYNYVSLDRNDVLALDYSIVGLSLLDSGRTEKAIEYFKKAIELSPGKSPIAYGELSEIYYARGDLDLAEEYSTKAIEGDVSYGWSHINRGFIRTKSGNIEGALKDYGVGLTIAPEYSSRVLRRLKYSGKIDLIPLVQDIIDELK